MNIGSNLCINCETRVIENKTSGLCASCGHEQRKSERNSLKPEKKKKRINQVSEKRKGEIKEYTVMRKEFLTEYPICQCSFDGLCNSPSEEIHHTSKSALNYLNTTTWMAVCRDHHNIIERHLTSEFRRENGLLQD